MSKTKTPAYKIIMAGTAAWGLAKKPADFGQYVEDACRFNNMPLVNAKLVRQSTGEVVATYRAPSFVVDA